MKKHKYKRFTFTEISYHWAYAMTFMPLLVTGSIMILQKMFSVEWIAKETLVESHKYIGISFIVAPFLIALAGDWRIHITNLIEALTWKKRDFLWIYKMSIQSKDIPEAGKFNPGQKINMLLSVFNYFAFTATGLIMWLKNGALSAWYIHIILFVFAVPMIAGHLFLAMINRSTRPGFPGIFTGDVPLDYIEHHHSLMLKEQRKLVSFKGWWKMVVIVPLSIVLFNIVLIIASNKVIEEQAGYFEEFNEVIVMPGELIFAHKKEEKSKNCYACHELSGRISDKKCLACHEKIQQRINQKKGYHAQFSENCASCHSDHKGEQYNPVVLNKAEFNHDQALFSLNGKHKVLKCEECHSKKDTQFIGISFSLCADCHQDKHKGQFQHKGRIQKNCSDCHNESGWKGHFLQFDHKKDSKFLLQGKHQDISCKECHKKISGIVEYKPIQHQKCSNCHSDPHQNQFKLQQCNDCHNESNWKRPFLNFDHQKTKFPLLGSHIKTSCRDCHKKVLQNPVRYKLKTSCISCHDDPHGGQFKKQLCTSCHNESSWKRPLLNFDHQKTKFPLLGSHIKTSCRDCHKKVLQNPVRYKLKTSCISCHDDPHQGQFQSRNCIDCHNENSWKKPFLHFEHNIHSVFKLQGKHQTVACNECHKKRGKAVTYKNIAFNKCTDCHEDIHRGMNRNCTQCHTEQNWTGKDLNFRHKETKFPLGHDHVNVNCSDCHTQKNIFTVNDFSCKKCHKDYAEMVAGTYMTKKPLPDHHYEAVSCKKCHIDSTQKSILEPEKMCSRCHTSFYEKLYFDQRLHMNEVLRKIKKSNRKKYAAKMGAHNFALFKKLLPKKSN